MILGRTQSAAEFFRFQCITLVHREMTIFINADAVTRTVLANGLTVLIYRNPAAPVVAVNTYVRAGYFDETDDVAGIAHVLEHMYFKGTAMYGVGEIAKATKAAGGYLNAHTIYDHTSYYAVLPSSGFDDGLAVQADAYANSAIEADALAKELEVIIQEAMRKEDNAGAVTTETLYALLHDRHRIRRWRIGRPDALRGFTRDDVARFYRNFYTPSNTVLAIAGDVDPAETLERVKALYGALPAGEPVRTPGPAEPAHSGFRYEELNGDVEQTHVEIGWRTVPNEHPDAGSRSGGVGERPRIAAVPCGERPEIGRQRRRVQLFTVRSRRVRDVVGGRSCDCGRRCARDVGAARVGARR
jgi:zinc protease